MIDISNRLHTIFTLGIPVPIWDFTAPAARILEIYSMIAGEIMDEKNK